MATKILLQSIGNTQNQDDRALDNQSYKSHRIIKSCNKTVFTNL